VFVRANTNPGVARPTDTAIRHTLHDLLAMVERGEVKPIVSEVLSFDDIARAHELMERSSFFGKIVLVP
jgi:NADPH:quinone reductase-like Zn-dependent oxidoreductase